MFKVQDLMINVMSGSGGGSAGMPAPTEETPPSPISPIAVTQVLEYKLQLVDKYMKLGKVVELEQFDELALDVGRMLVGVHVAAYCTEDMATCDNNARISPLAHEGLGVLKATDFGVLKQQVNAASEWIDQRGDVLEKRAVENKAMLVDKLTCALAYLKG